MRNRCDEHAQGGRCGAEMRYLGNGMIMCSRTYDLALRRYLAGDMRAVTHESLEDVPDVVVREPECST